MTVTKPTIGQSNWGPITNAALDYLDAADATNAAAVATNTTAIAGKVAKDALTLNVMDYGAVGNGVADDTAAVNAAITAASAGQTVLIPHGKTFMIDADYNTGKSIIPKSGVNIRVDGVLQAIGNSLATSSVIRGRSVNGFSITGNGTIIGERATHTGAASEGGMCVRLEAVSNVSISGVTLADAHGDGLYLTLYSGVYSTDVRVTNVGFRNCYRNGATVAGAIGVSFAGCSFYGTNGTSPQAGLDCEPNGADIVRAVTVTGCVFRDNTAKGIQFADGCTDMIAADNVFDGAHTDSAIRIAGEHISATGNTIRGGVIGINASLSAQLTIANNQIGGTSSYGISANQLCDESTIMGNTVLDTGDTAIYTKGLFGFVISNNVVARSAGAGIQVDYFSGSSIGNGQIHHNVVTDAGLNGIQVAVPNVDINHNVIIGASKTTTNTSFGIYLATGATTTDCRITDNIFRVGSTGAQVKYGVKIITGVLRTYISDNDYYGAVATQDVSDSGTGTMRGTTTRTSAGGLQHGFYGATPIARPANSVDALTALINMGLIATGSSIAGETATSGIAGTFIGYPVATSDAVLTASRVYWWKVTVNRAFTFDQAVFRVAVASGNVDVGIYATTANAPGTKVVASGSVACPAVGKAVVALTSTVITPGLYWLALAADNATASFGVNARSSEWLGCYVKSSTFPLPTSGSGSTATIGSLPVMTLEKS